MLTKIKQFTKSVFGPASSYFTLRTGDERAFWKAPCPRGLWRTAREWPSGRGLHYLGKILLIRIVTPWLVAGFVLAAIVYGLIVVVAELAGR